MTIKIATETLELGGKTYPILFNQKDVSQSSPYAGNRYPANNALKDMFTHTNRGVGQWWKANFAEEFTFTKIRIKNRSSCCGQRLARTKVFISGKLCGSLPNRTDNGKWYEVNCNITGKEIKLVTVQNTWLSIQGIQAFATKSNAYKLTINPSDLSQSSPYAGNRYPASNALINRFTHTNRGRGQWFRAKFGKNYTFKRIYIRNRIGCCGGRLAKTKVFISGKFCGSLPDRTTNGRWYQVNCKIRGNEIKLVTVQNTFLSIQGIKAFVTEGGNLSNSQNKSTKVEINPNDVYQSSSYHNYFPARNSLVGRGQGIITNKGVGQWWKAKFKQQYTFTKIRIRNRIVCCGHRLAFTKVFVSGKLCGTLPNKTENGKWYEINCKVKGNEIKLVTATNTYLQFTGIEAFAIDTNTNKLATTGNFKVPINPNDLSQSSPYAGNRYPAKNALINRFTHTNRGIGQWFRAKFGQNYNFTKIRIRNRIGCCGGRLARTKVFISGKLCGSLPSRTTDGRWYEVNCNITGNEIKLVTVQNTWLSIQGIQAFANKKGPLLNNPNNSNRIMINQNDVSQSSNYGNNAYPAKNAIIGGGRMAITNKGVGQWYRVQFKEEYYISKIRIRNRINCCGQRLARTKVMISGKLCGSLPSKTEDGKWYEVNCKITGSEIRLVTVQNTYLQITGIEAYGEITNGYPMIINEKDVSQSSSYDHNRFPASNALKVIGKYNGRVGPFTHTNAGVGQWWRAKFSQSHNIKRIRIKNRSDCCGQRLARTRVMISGRLCGSLPTRTENGKWYEVNCNITGNEVKLVTVQNTFLSIEGIEIFSAQKEDLPMDLKRLGYTFFETKKSDNDQVNETTSNSFIETIKNKESNKADTKKEITNDKENFE